MEFIYCVLSPAWQHCKVGIWQGHYEDLWQRYATTLGSEMTTVVIFQCQGRRALENIFFGYLRKLHVCNEVYEKEALQPFLQFGSVMCSDRCTMPVVAHLKKQERRHKKLLAWQKRADEVKNAELVMESVLRFIKEYCVVGSQYFINTTPLKAAFEEFHKQPISSTALNNILRQQGFVKTKKKISGSSLQAFTGIKLVQSQS